MSFTAIDTAVPGGDTLAEAVAKVNAGFVDTLREIVLGAVPGWNWSFEGADPLAPSAVVWTNGQHQVKIAFSYAGGRVASALYRASTDGGSTWTNKGTETYSYDGNGYLTATTWS
jgi:YD repeat-containing protein